MKPHYPLKLVKEMLRKGQFRINEDVLNDAYNLFGWDDRDIVRCLLKLNSKHHIKNRLKNHFYKTEEHYRFPPTKMDYYKAINILEGNDIYTHFYRHPSSGELVISSFHEL